MRIPLPIGTYRDRSPSASSRVLVNCSAEQAPVDGKSPVILRRMPGIDSWATAGTGIRGRHAMAGVEYVVSGETLYKVTSAGVATSLGTIPGSNQVSMADNGSTLVIVTNPDGYYTTGTSVTQITDSTFTGWGAQDVDYIDGYFTFTSADSRRLFNSGLNALTFNALDFTSIDGATDNIVGHIVDHREIFVGKQCTCELWYDAGNASGSPFSRSPGGFLEVGCASKHTLAKIDGSIFWLADDATIRRLSGNTPQVISTPGISEYLRGETLSEAWGFAYTFEDRFYYVLTLGGVTLEYDIRANEWHNRESYGKEYWTPLTIADVYGATQVYDGQSGKIGRLNSRTHTEWGDPQIVKWTYQPLYREGRRFFLDRFEIAMQTGVGLTSGQGSSPLLMHHISYDGGQTFMELPPADLGALGEYDSRVFWTRLGSGYNIVHRMELSDPVDMIAFDTIVDLRDGRY